MAAPKPERLKAADVCQLAQVQPYVLRTWEAEFPELGRSVDGGPRIYGRADVERVLKIRELVFDEGLTLAGVRRRLVEVGEERRDEPAEQFTLVDATTRQRLQSVRDGLIGLLALLDKPTGEPSLVLTAGDGPSKPARPARRGKR
jgi:DNA-binding transcriptional MerR regulator